MNEKDFLQQLQNRAKEQEQVMNGMPFPHIFTSVSVWLGNHPWRLLIPFAFLLSLVFHFTIGKGYDNLILKIFGGIGIVRLLTM